MRIAAVAVDAFQDIDTIADFFFIRLRNSFAVE